MTSFVICLIFMSVYCAQGQLNFAWPWDGQYHRSYVSEGDQQANHYQDNNFDRGSSYSAASSYGGNAASSSSSNTGYDENGTYYERDVIENTIGTALYHHERIHWPSLGTTKFFRYTIDLTNPNAQPVWDQNYITPRPYPKKV